MKRRWLRLRPVASPEALSLSQRQSMPQAPRPTSRLGGAGRPYLDFDIAPYRFDQPIGVHVLQRCEAGGLKVRGEHHAIHSRDRAVHRRQPVGRLLVWRAWCTRFVASAIIVLEHEGERGSLLQRWVGGASPGAFGLWRGVAKISGCRGLLASALLHTGHPIRNKHDRRVLWARRRRVGGVNVK
eukprot:scaffold123931_cov63-Phaeocystis_antarctica.AAC.2